MRDKATELLVEKIAAELARIRKAKGISHQTLADKTGVSRSGISFIENHKRDPKLSTCIKMAKALGVRLADILDRIEK